MLTITRSAIQQQIKSSECKFVVLQIGARQKAELRAALREVALNFEPYLVLLLREPIPRSRRL